MFSKACEYGIRACVYIAEHSMMGEKVSLKQVAEATGSPEAYTSKILQALNRNHILRSEKGPSGGFLMDGKQLKTVRLDHIVFALDGENIYKGCGLGLRECNEKMPCPLHHQFATIRADLKSMLEQTTVRSLAVDLMAGTTFLKR